MWNEVLISVGVSLLRSLSGWLENAAADGKIELPEARQLAETWLRLLIPYLSLWLGFELEPFQAGFVAIIFDIVVVKMAKLIKAK